MENGKKKWKILIAEDEEIERESLKTILYEHFKNSVQLLLAKNGRDALETYARFLPDIVLMDINMPILNGLEAIEEMKKYHQECRYIILTSYDYFHYAQEAIRLGVEDFLLKPSSPKTIVESVSQALSSMKMAKNQEKSAGELYKKYQEIRPLLEHDCLYSILMRSSEMEIQSHLKYLNINAKSAVCFVVESDEKLKSTMLKLKTELSDIGYSCLYQYIKKVHVMYLIHNQKLQLQDLEVIEHVVAQYHLRIYPIGLGAVQNEIKNFSDSYVLAMRNLHTYGADEILHFPRKEEAFGKQTMDIAAISDQLIQCFQSEDDEAMQQLIQEFSRDLIIHQYSDMEAYINALLKQLVEKLNVLMHTDIELQKLPKIRINKNESFQNIELSLYYVLHVLFYPLREERIQNTSALAKQGMAYIRKNFRKPITLNDLAKHLKVSPFYVSKLIKSSYQKNFTDVVAEIRIEEAKRLLKEHHRVKEIAFEVGFQSQSYFAKMFKKIVGVTPSEYQDFFQ